MKKKIIIAAVIMMALTACKMYDWRYQYTGHETRELTPALMDSLKQKK